MINDRGGINMTLDDVRKYCLSKKGVEEDFPFDDKILVFKVGSKMFLLTNIKSSNFAISLKCDPILASALRGEFDAIKPGYHLNKKHWNTIEIDGSIPENKLYSFIDLSYDLVFKGLKKAEKENILK